VRLVFTEPRSGAGARGDRSDRHQRMAEEQPEQLATGVPGGSGHTYLKGHDA
jgi:hypothetical protein